LKDFEELVDGEEAADTRLEAQLIGKLSERLLPFLFKLVDTLHDPRQLKTPVNDEAEPENDSAMTLGQFHGGADQADRVRAVAQAIASLAQVASRQLLQSLFSKVIQRLLEASQAEDDLSEKMCSLLTLSQALVTSKNLDQPSISLLYRSLKPLIRTDETKPRIQKRAYKVLAEICNRYHAFVTESKQVKELLELLTSSTATSQISARFMRIKCLNYIVNAFAGSSELDTVSLHHESDCFLLPGVQKLTISLDFI
jgi:ribosomal RNA-processing protein 12